MPAPGEQSYYAPLTSRYALGWAQDQTNFIAGSVTPPTPVELPQANYYKFNKADWLKQRLQPRASGTRSAGGGFSLSTDNYHCKVYANHIILSNQDFARWNHPNLSIENATTQILVQGALQSREAAFVQSLFTTGIWGGGNFDAIGNGTTPYTSDLSPGDFVKWSNDTGSDPIGDVLRYKRYVALNGAGFAPNIGVCSQKVFDVLSVHPRLLARVSGGATSSSPASLSLSLIAQLLGLEQIYVMKAVTDNAVDNETASPAYIAGDHFLLAHIDRTENPLTASAWRTFAWTGGSMRGVQIAIYNIPAPDHGDGARKLEIEMSWDDKATANELAVLLANAV